MATYPTPTRHEWIQPRMRGYRMMCCDCGLVHEIQFRVVFNRLGQWKLVSKRTIPHFVQMKVKRHNRATAAARRKFETIRVIKGPKAKTR